MTVKLCAEERLATCLCFISFVEGQVFPVLAMKACRGMESWFLGLPATVLVTILAELLWIPLVFARFFWSFGVVVMLLFSMLVALESQVEHYLSWQRLSERGEDVVLLSPSGTFSVLPTNTSEYFPVCCFHIIVPFDTLEVMQIQFKKSFSFLIELVSDIQICQFYSLIRWNVTEHRFVVSYQRFGTTYRFDIQGLSSPRRLDWWVIWECCRLPVFALQHSRRARISFALQWKPEIMHC
jgi:hypothetical protein